jgi:spore coat polysaccharide biosynthesis protein SpsF
MNAKRKVVAILQARMGSARLPGKVLADLEGRPLLERIVRRLAPARLFDAFVVATTEQPEDEPIVALAGQLGVPCFRGSEEDCLDRYYQCAKAFQADVVVRLTGDNPLIDARFCDWVVEQFLSAEPPWDYVETYSSKTFPVGLSVEVFSFAALATAWREASAGPFREHVTYYLDHGPKPFRVLALAAERDYSSLRWTVDTPEDLAYVRTIYSHLGDSAFSWQELVALLEQHPQWQEGGRCVQQKVVV